MLYFTMVVGIMLHMGGAEIPWRRFPLPTTLEDHKIKLTSNFSVVDMFGFVGSQENVQNLLDEQQRAGDPKYHPKSAGECYTPWAPTNREDFYPTYNPNVPSFRAGIDLGAVYTVSNVYLYHSGSLGYKLRWSIAKDNPYLPHYTWEETAQSPAWKAQGWHYSNVSQVGRFISLELMSNPHASIKELVFYGSTAGLKQYRDPQPRRKVPPSSMRLLLGTNGFPWSPIEQMTKAVGAVREYNAWAWTEGGSNPHYPGYPHNENSFQCLALGGRCYDWVLGNVSKTHLKHTWHHDMLDTPPWLHDYNATEKQWKALTRKQMWTMNASITPDSYIATADHMWQVAARYGRQKVPDSELKLWPYMNVSVNKVPQPKRSGLDYLDWLEVYNEPNKWWLDREAFYSGQEHGAAASAAYDGHCNTMPKTVGIKQVDPSMKVALSGLCDKQMYGRLWSLVYWGKAHRPCDGRFPADAMNVHIYANTAYGKKTTSKSGVSPEQYGIFKIMGDMSDMRDRLAPDVELWISEFGYDTYPTSPNHAYPIGPWSGEEMQGVWNIRSVFGFASVGVNRAHQFLYTDTNSQSGATFATSGLVDQNHNPKAGWYWYTCAFNTMADYYFISQSCQNEGVCVQQWNTASNGQGRPAITFWVPTANNTRVDNFEIVLPSRFGPHALLATPTNKVFNCSQSILKITDGNVTVTALENPQWIMAGIPSHPSPTPPPTPPTPAPTPTPPTPTPPTPPPPTPTPPTPAPPGPTSCSSHSTPGMWCTSGAYYIQCPTTSAKPQFRQCAQQEQCEQNGEYVKCKGAPPIDPCSSGETGKFCDEAFYPGQYSLCPGNTKKLCPPGMYCKQNGTVVDCTP